MRLFLCVREQAFDADRHVIDAAGGIQARRDREGEIRRGQVRA